MEIEDLSRIPQNFAELAGAAGDRLMIGDACSGQLLDEFKERFFSRWTLSVPLYDPAESIKSMKKDARGGWYGTNKRKVAREQKQELLDNCDLDTFPSRSDKAIAVAPGHLRGLPTRLPFYERREGAPFDMLSNPQVKLNEPLRVLHTSKDGVWYFVETGYSNGWLERRDVALVDAAFIDSWMQSAPLVIVRDYQPVADGRGIGIFPAKIGTILPLGQAGNGWWEVRVASAGEGGKAETRTSRIPRDAAAPFPLPFNKEKVALLGDQMLGQPYGWGESYALRDCSALLRDFFLPFGIWIPRTSADQIASVRQRLQLAALAPPEKEELIKRKSLPFLTLLYKPGHIMLYAGEDREGRPLVFHSAWSIRIKEGEGERTQVVGTSAITTLEPGKELGLVPGGSLLERATELTTITDRCKVSR
ncbi:MAG: hypothetical protein A2075_20985 [Geobacteraceae bacterium GWC2_58_44]|nr:MAG: hypothetical protein A2075_20985 [Geobacteraceae bacterium GWC2_58_44]